MEGECTFYRLNSFENSGYLKLEVIYNLEIPIQSKRKTPHFFTDDKIPKLL